MAAMNKPAKLLLVNFTLGTATKFYNDDLLKPYAWNAILTVTPQPHSNFVDDDGFYDALDVKVGDHIATSNNGTSLEIVQIINATTTTINCVVEDIDRSNALLDPNQAGDSAIPNGQGIVFEIEENRPILYPLPNALPGTFTATFPSQLLNRFQHKKPLNLQGIVGTGSQGTTGAQGIQGITGSQGIQGITGSQGIQGRQGITGSQGIQGIGVGSNTVVAYTFKINFLDGVVTSTVQELPSNWSSSVVGSTVTITHNLNKMLKYISYLGSNTGSGSEQFRYRLPTAANEAFIMANVKLTQFSFLVSSAVVASDLNGYAYVTVLF